jgi:hypothetical protein
MMRHQGKRRRKSNVVYIPMTHVWNFFLLTIYLFILENEIKAVFNLIFLNFNIQRTSMQSTPFFCVCICNNNSIIGITNSFSQVESSILNNFNKYQ